MNSNRKGNGLTNFRNLFPLNDDDSCGLSYEQRTKTIEQYLDKELSSLEADSFQEHFFHCDTCFAELQFRQNLGKTLRQSSENAPKIYRKQHFLRYASAAATVVILMLVGYAIYQTNLPDYYHQASLTEVEQRSLYLGMRGEAESQDEFTKAAEALLLAPKKRLGVIPGFDSTQVEIAILHLKKAIANNDDDTNRNKYAYFIAKAYLMKSDVDSAHYWLDQIFHSDATAYQAQANKLLNHLK